MQEKARLFALAEHLRARRTGVTAEKLAAKFGVRVTYRHSDGTVSERVVRAKRLLAERTRTILEREDLGDEAPRRLRLDRIEKAWLENPAG